MVDSWETRVHRTKGLVWHSLLGKIVKRKYINFTLNVEENRKVGVSITAEHRKKATENTRVNNSRPA